MVDSVSRLCRELNLTPLELSFIQSLMLLGKGKVCLAGPDSYQFSTPLLPIPPSFLQIINTGPALKAISLNQKTVQEIEFLYHKTMIAYSLYVATNFPSQPSRFGLAMTIIEMLKSNRALFQSVLTAPIVKFVIDNF